MKKLPRSSLQPTFADERFVESQFDAMAFDRLLHLAEAGWLRKPLDHSAASERDDHPETELVSRLGIHGLRAALESSMGVTTYNPAKPHDPGTEQEFVIDPVRSPDFYSGPMNREISLKTDRFGARLLDEAYEVLGKGADEQVELFRTATSDDEQLSAIGWLCGRLQRLTVGRRGLQRVEEEDDDAIYHPLRFSPKALGSYPNHTFEPTCLGLAIIGAGFLQKTGAEFMHAGVMETTGEWEVVTCIDLTSVATSDEMVQKFGTDMPDVVKERLLTKSHKAALEVSKYRGTHSALVVRLQSGLWCQIDTNYNSSTLFSISVLEDGTRKPVQHEKLSDIHTTLTEFKDLAPGLELSQSFSCATPQDLLKDILERMEIGEGYRQEVERLVAAMGDESVIESFREYFTAKFRDTVQTDEDLLYWSREFSLFDYVLQPYDDVEIDVFDEDFRWVFERFVQWDMPIDEWVRRCRDDARFRDDRITDLMRVPLLLAIRYAYTLQGRVREPQAHSMLEFGLPESSFGRAALNNIAIYLGDELTAHHWISQWTSQNAITDRLPHADRSRAQAAVLGNCVGEILSGHLRYITLSGKITEFGQKTGVIPSQEKVEAHAQAGPEEAR